MSASVSRLKIDKEYPIEINNGEGFGIQLTDQDAEIVYKELGVVLGKTIAIHNVPELAAALNDLEHLRKFRNDLQRENARVALKNQTLVALLMNIRTILEGTGSQKMVIDLINETIGA